MDACKGKSKGTITRGVPLYAIVFCFLLAQLVAFLFSKPTPKSTVRKEHILGPPVSPFWGRVLLELVLLVCCLRPPPKKKKKSGVWGSWLWPHASRACAEPVGAAAAHGGGAVGQKRLAM